MVASQTTLELTKKGAVVDDQYQLLRHQISIGWPAATADIPTDLREFETFADELLKQTDSCSKARGSSSCARPEPSYCNEFIRHTSVLMDVYAEREKLFSIPY